MKELFKKYDIPVPRYTSYPTVPYWEDNLRTDLWIEHLQKWMNTPTTSWSMYIHVPFCESLCTYCGCNTAITKNHKVEVPYVTTLLNELNTYQALVPALRDRPMRHIHIGGGTPTFLSADNLARMVDGIFEKIQCAHEEFEASIEIDPRRTKYDQLKALRERGFNRVSLGVQDFNPEVQRLVNRIQSFELTREILDHARDLGYESVNFDLIYGLAKQTPDTMRESVAQTIELRPDRIALYSFALVPWIKPAQRLFKDEDLPRGGDKRALYEVAREMLLEHGYLEIGMDHFALPTDALAKASRNQRLHRNFMGYTDQRTDVMLGLGVSAISETPDSFHQNEKILHKYEETIQSGKVATLRGHALTSLDRARRAQILSLLTRLEAELESEHQSQDAVNFLTEMIQDGLAEVRDKKVIIAENGRPFMRNIAMVFDERLRALKPETQTFSQSL